MIIFFISFRHAWARRGSWEAPAIGFTRITKKVVEWESCYELCNWLNKSLENQQKYLIVCELVDCNIAVFLHWLTTDWPSIESSRSECEIRNRSRLWIDAVGSRCLDFGGKNPTIFATRGSSRKDFFQVIRRPRGCNWMWISLTQLIRNLVQNRRKTKWDLIC